MRGGVLWGRKRNRGGSGMPLITTVGLCERRSLAWRKDTIFLERKSLLEPFGITRFYTDGWGAYERHIDPAQHHVAGEAGEYPENREQTHQFLVVLGRSIHTDRGVIS